MIHTKRDAADVGKRERVAGKGPEGRGKPNGGEKKKSILFKIRKCLFIHTHTV